MAPRETPARPNSAALPHLLLAPCRAGPARTTRRDTGQGRQGGQARQARMFGLPAMTGAVLSGAGQVKARGQSADALAGRAGPCRHCMLIMPRPWPALCVLDQCVSRASSWPARAAPSGQADGWPGRQFLVAGSQKDTQPAVRRVFAAPRHTPCSGCSRDPLQASRVPGLIHHKGSIARRHTGRRFHLINAVRDAVPSRDNDRKVAPRCPAHVRVSLPLPLCKPRKLDDTHTHLVFVQQRCLLFPWEVCMCV